jgi:hypothetical protein
MTILAIGCDPGHWKREVEIVGYVIDVKVGGNGPYLVVKPGTGEETASSASSSEERREA